MRFFQLNEIGEILVKLGGESSANMVRHVVRDSYGDSKTLEVL